MRQSIQPADNTKVLLDEVLIPRHNESPASFKNTLPIVARFTSWRAVLTEHASLGKINERGTDAWSSGRHRASVDNESKACSPGVFAHFYGEGEHEHELELEFEHEHICEGWEYACDLVL